MALLLSLVAAVVVAAPGTAAGTGHITGVVTGRGDVGLANVDVYAYRYDSSRGYWNYAALAGTTTSGAYDLSRLAEGRYRLRFYNDSYVPEYWNDKPSLDTATDIMVAAGGTSSGISPKLTAYSRIQGTVSDADGVALPGIAVRVYQPSAFGDGWDVIGPASSTNTSGAYSIGSLRAGRYRVGFEPSNGEYDAEYWDDAPTVGAASDIVVAASATVTGKDAQLAKLSHITGTVTGVGSAALDGVTVSVYSKGADNRWLVVRTAQTRGTGAYDINGLRPGTYRIGFDPNISSPYFGEYWNDKPNVESASNVVVAQGSIVSGKNARLTRFAHITGRVSGPGNAALSGLEVTAFQYSDGEGRWLQVGSATTTTAGTYDISRLTAGAYRLRFSDPAGSYVTEYYDNAANVYSAADVSVAAGATASAKNAELIRGSHLTGRVTGSDDIALPNVSVIVYRWNTASNYWEQLPSTTTTDGSGNYDVSALPAGSYRLGFRPDSRAYAEEFWQDKPNLDAADDIVVGPATTVSGKNAKLATASHIAGTVTGPSGTPLAGVSVTAYTRFTWGWGAARSTTTSTAGTYDLDGLAAGTYRIRFEDGDFLTEYWNNAPTVDSAEDVVVGPGVTVRGKNAQLSAGGHITGRVTGSGGVALPNVSVYAYRMDGAATGGGIAWTDAAGAYDVGGLPPGSYRLGFSKQDYVVEFYNDKATLYDAVDLVVRTGATVSGKDAKLAEAGRIQGRVTGTGGAGLGGVTVAGYTYVDAGGYWRQAFSTFTDSLGNYDLQGLSAGTYRIGFKPPDSSYVREYWDDKLSVEAATDVAVASGVTVTGKDAELSPGGHITGRVTSPTGAPVASADVTVYQFSSYGYWTSLGHVVTDASGAYDIGDLAAGTYRLGFADPTRTYAPEFWNDKATVWTATDIVVAKGATVTGRNARLAAGSHITGTVTGPTGGGLADVSVTARRYVATSGSSFWENAGVTSTTVAGGYDLGGLPAGTYRVEFSPSSAHVGEYWNDAPTLETATDIVVGSGVTVPGTNAQLDSVSHITGTVTGPDGVPMPDASVTAYAFDEGNWEPVDDGVTSANGRYDVDQLPAGTYRLRFAPSDDDHLVEYWSNQGSIQSAADIVVGAGDTVSGKNARLAVAAHISGTVTGPSGTPLDDIIVEGYRYDAAEGEWVWAWGANTTSAGSYDIGRLPPGTYRVKFLSSTYAIEFWDDKPDIGTAANIPIAAGATVSGKDAQLAAGGSISGRVQDSAGSGAREIAVRAYRKNAAGVFEPYADGYAYNGDYTVTGLRAGTYRLFFEPSSGSPLQSEYFNDKPTLATATNLVITTGQALRGKDVVLSAATGAPTAFSPTRPPAPSPSTAPERPTSDGNAAAWLTTE